MSGCPTDTIVGNQYHLENVDNSTIVRRPVRPFRRGKSSAIARVLKDHHHHHHQQQQQQQEQQQIPTLPIIHDEGMIARANRIRAMFSLQLREPVSFPGISRDKTGEPIYFIFFYFLFIHFLIFLRCKKHDGSKIYSKKITLRVTHTQRKENMYLCQGKNTCIKI